MTDPAISPGVPVAAPAMPDGRADRIAQLKAGGFVVAALAVLGAVLGIVWEAWSPPGPLGAVLPGGVQADETEAFVAGDGRFALIALIVGLIAGVAAWYLQRVRGPYLAIALAVGGIAGAVLTDVVGWATRGDTDDAKVGTVIQHLPLTVHMHALWFVEATAAVLVYSLFVAFASSDDLGRPEVGRAAQRTGHADWHPPPAPVGAAQPSVGTQGGLQDPWRHGDAAGAP